MLSYVRRRVFVVEQAKKHRANAVDAVREHLVQAARRVSKDWIVRDVSAIDNNGLVLAELRH